MKKPIFLLFLASFSLFNNSSCRKDEPPLVKLDPVFLSYFAFPKGSWWTYKEVNTGKTDSFFVNKYKTENLVDKKLSDDPYYETLSYHLFSKYDTAYGFAKPVTHIKLNTLLYEYVESYHVGPYGFDYSADRFIYPSEENETFNDYFYIREHMDTVRVNNILYKDVYKTENSRQTYNNPFKSEYYCRNVGIIKRIYFDNTIWELTNYHINK